MASEARIEMPNGDTLRVASQRRYIVASYYGDRWTIQFRSDDEGNALARWRSECRRYPAYPCHVVDRTERTVIR